MPFLSHKSNHKEIKKAGGRNFQQVYNSSSDRASLDELRTVNKSLRSVDVTDLPPTSNAAKYHSLRVYYQLHVWLENSDIKPHDWGWKRNGKKLSSFHDKKKKKVLRLIPY